MLTIKTIEETYESFAGAATPLPSDCVGVRCSEDARAFKARKAIFTKVHKCGSSYPNGRRDRAGIRGWPARTAKFCLDLTH
jgi:hypothetical protein